jgi:hypothetical protein
MLECIYYKIILRITVTQPAEITSVGTIWARSIFVGKVRNPRSSRTTNEEKFSSLCDLQQPFCQVALMK